MTDKGARLPKVEIDVTREKYFDALRILSEQRLRIVTLEGLLMEAEVFCPHGPSEMMMLGNRIAFALSDTENGND